MNIYLAGPMRGRDDLNRAAFNEAADRLRLEGHTVFNPAQLPEDIQNDIRACFKIDTECLCEWADAIAFLPGWEHSTGAFAEWALVKAINYGRATPVIEVIYLSE